MLFVWLLVVASCTYFVEFGKKFLAFFASLILFPVSIQVVMSLSRLLFSGDRMLPLYIGCIFATLMGGFVTVALARAASRREQTE